MTDTERIDWLERTGANVVADVNAALCGRIRRVSLGTPGHFGKPAMWAPALQEGER